jgi:hypothetical protein
MNDAVKEIRNKETKECVFCKGTMVRPRVQPQILYEEFVCNGCGFSARFVERDTKWLDDIKIGE